jgi:hypothetical protein
MDEWRGRQEGGAAGFANGSPPSSIGCSLRRIATEGSVCLISTVPFAAWTFRGTIARVRAHASIWQAIDIGKCLLKPQLRSVNGSRY